LKRTSKREIVFCMLYEASFFSFDTEIVIQNAQEFREIKICEYILDTFTGTVLKKTELDKVIEKYAKGWKLSRIPRVTLAILRLAVFEMLYNDDVPESVAINEAVELAKQYDNDEAPAFVNGILGSISQQEQITK